MDIIERSLIFATRAHSWQFRKYTGEPYIHHPISVAKIVGSVGLGDTAISAALLHDVVEDTGHTIADINVMFGDDISDLVSWLTDVSKPSDGNRKVRKEKYRKHISIAPPLAKSIKLADLIDNSISIVSRDPKFAKVYMAEKRSFLEVLKDGNKVLFNHAKFIVDNYYSSIKP
jgi:(p)ppGpp synthase/HD superfamily hydrolase